jgi:hypothetical protein
MLIKVSSMPCDMRIALGFWLQARISYLESAFITKDKEVEGLQRMLDSANSTARAATDATGTASRLHLPATACGGAPPGTEKEYIQKFEMELAANKARLAHLEHVARSR